MTERKEATVSQIKQYGARGPLSDPPILGEYIMVTYADHLAALRACEQRVLDAALKELYLMENMGGYPEFDFDHIRDDFRDVIDSLKENR